MNLRRTWAVARKEFLHVLRDPRSLGMGIVIPMFMLVVFGFALTLDLNEVPLAVWDQSNTPASRDFLSHFTGSPYFSVRYRVGSYQEIQRLIDDGRAMAALVVPREFQTHPAAGRRNNVLQMIVDGSDANTATLLIGYAQAITQNFAEDLLVQQSLRQSGKTLEFPLDSRPRVWFNADMESKNFIVPGLIAVVMMVIAALLTSLTVAREWEGGSMEQLIATPVQSSELILGKLIPYFSIGMFDVAAAVLMGVLLFHVPLRGSVLLVFAMAAVFLVGVLSMGILISTVTKNQLVASQVAMTATFLPAFLLSGFMIPIVNMPWPIQMFTYVVPARYFIDLLRGIYLKGADLRILGFQALLLSVFGVLMLVVAVAKFRKRLE